MIAFLKKEKNLALLSVIAIFLALVRLLAECFRLEYTLHREILFSQLKPFLYAAIICSVSIFSMSLMLFRQRYKWMVAMAIFTILVLVIIKIVYRDYFID